MPKMTKPDLVDALRDIDFAMLSTISPTGDVASRPMSNNGEVEFSGTSYYFTWSHARMCKDIEANPEVGLTFQSRAGLFGRPPTFISVQGNADIVTDKAAFAAHWNAGLDRWFKEGPETVGVVMLQVEASRITYWDGEDTGTYDL
jgi:general stress protein 26